MLQMWSYLSYLPLEVILINVLPFLINLGDPSGISPDSCHIYELFFFCLQFQIAPKQALFIVLFTIFSCPGSSFVSQSVNQCHFQITEQFYTPHYQWSLTMTKTMIKHCNITCQSSFALLQCFSPTRWPSWYQSREPSQGGRLRQEGSTEEQEARNTLCSTVRPDKKYPTASINA